MCGGLCSHSHHDWEQLGLGVDIFASVKLEVISEGVTQVSFIRNPQWAPLYLSKSTYAWHPYESSSGHRLKVIMVVLWLTLGGDVTP